MAFRDKVLRVSGLSRSALITQLSSAFFSATSARDMPFFLKRMSNVGQGTSKSEVKGNACSQLDLKYFTLGDPLFDSLRFVLGPQPDARVTRSPND